MSGISGFGASFQRYNGSTYDAIAKVFGLSGPNLSRDTIEVTTQDSTNRWREYIGGLRDGGEVTFSVNFTRAGYFILKNDFENDAAVLYKVVLPDANSTELLFSGLITELPLEAPEDDRIVVNVTVKVSGQVTDTET